MHITKEKRRQSGKATYCIILFIQSGKDRKEIRSGQEFGEEGGLNT
jgi:hypothetical protein